MANKLTRRGFLWLVGSPAAAPIIAGCSSQAVERLQSNLESTVNELAIEAGRRGEFFSGQGYFNSYRLEQDWRWPVLVKMASDKTLPIPENFDANRLADASDYAARGIVRSRAFDEYRKVLEGITNTSPLYIGGIKVEDHKLVFPNVWGGTNLYPDLLDILVFTREGYRDIFRFVGIRGDGTNDTKVFYDSKEENIRKVQQTYKLTEPEARKRISEWLPALLQTAKEIYVMPHELPQEKWLPQKLWLTSNPLYSKIIR